MSSIVIDKSPVSTPAHEWAQQTTTALSSQTFAAADGPPAESAATTPGVDLPGSFPRELGTKEPKDALDPIASSLPSIETAREEATRVLGTVSETVKSYLPESVAKVLLGTAPETQEKGLDASLDPTSTAKPQDVDSDISGAPLSGSANAAAGTTFAVSGVATALNLDPTSDNKPKSTGNDPTDDPQVQATNEKLENLQLEKKLEEIMDDAAQSRNQISVDPVNENSTNVTEDPAVAATNEKLSNLGSQEKHVDDAVNARSPPIIHSDSIAPTPPPKDESEVFDATERHDQPALNTTPAQQHILSHDDSTANTKTEANGSGSRLTESFNSSSDVHARSSSNLSGTSLGADGQKKPKFMDKVKGEMKIVSGKIGRNPEKIEEGKRLKGALA